jgi:non-heme chloroperoxidase
MACAPLLAIVDDDEPGARALANLLRAMGFSAQGFASAVAFLRSSQRRRPDCVIVDARMPGVDGLRLARALAGAARPIPIIFLSASADARTRAEASRLGAVAFLTKPCREGDLLAAVADALHTTNPDRGGTMATMTTGDGTEIFYKDWGSGQPIVFSHGWPLSADDWDAQLLFFRRHGYRVVAHDRRGHGRSSQPDEGHDMDHYADDLAALTAHLGLENAVHVGHSTGGGEVVRYLARHGEHRVAKAVIIGAVPPLMVKTAANPGGLPKEVFDGFQAQVAANRAQFYYDVPAGPFYGFNRPGAKPSQGIIWNWWRQGMMGGAKAHHDGIVAFSQTDFTDDLKRIGVPVLVMHGDDDQIVPYADSAPLSAALLKNGTLKTYSGFPHGMTTTHADTINTDLLAFIQAEPRERRQP